MMDAASTAIVSSQPAESLQQMLGVSLDASLFSLFGDAVSQQVEPRAPPSAYPRASNSSSGSYSSTSQSPSMQQGASSRPHRAPASTAGSTPQRAGESHPDARPHFDGQSPVSASELAQALMAASDAAHHRPPTLPVSSAVISSPSPQASRTVSSPAEAAATVMMRDMASGRPAPRRPSASPAASSPPAAEAAAAVTMSEAASRMVANNIVPGPSRSAFVHTPGGAMSSASGDEEPACAAGRGEKGVRKGARYSLLENCVEMRYTSSLALPQVLLPPCSPFSS